MTSNISSAKFFSYRDHLALSGNELFANAPSQFSLHSTKEKCARLSYQLTRYLSLPWRLSLRFLAYTIEPLPGANKNKKLLGAAIRVGSCALAILLLPLGVLSLPFALPFHLYSHSRRPWVTSIHNPKAITPHPNANTDTLHVRSHNLGFVYEFLRVIGDLRNVKTRAEEIGDWILKDEQAPEVICFQEAFHISGTEVLCNKLKEKYPYVIHSIAPHILGLNNGGIIASMYPIKDFSYRPFDNLIGPEKWSTRGLLRVRIEKGGKNIDVYSTHTQALLGKKRAQVRKEQMEQMVSWIEEDTKVTKEKADLQILVGDLNSSKVTAWGEENHEDDPFFNVMETHFDDIFLNDHDEKGERTVGAPQFLKNDTPGEGPELKEPSGSWYVGPFATKGLFIRIKEWYEKVFNGVSKKALIKSVPADHGWGTSKWSKVQHACTARFDYILRRKGSGQGSNEDRVEIRKMKVAHEIQSASSDHAPVDGILKF